MKTDTVRLAKDYPSEFAAMPGEMTRKEIAVLLGVSPARVSQYTFIPKPLRRVGRYFYYDTEKVLEAIEKQYPKTPKIKPGNIFMKLMAGHFDTEERRREYDVLKKQARAHSVVTERVYIKGVL